MQKLMLKLLIFLLQQITHFVTLFHIVRDMPLFIITILEKILYIGVSKFTT